MVCAVAMVAAAAVAAVSAAGLEQRATVGDSFDLGSHLEPLRDVLRDTVRLDDEAAAVIGHYNEAVASMETSLDRLLVDPALSDGCRLRLAEKLLRRLELMEDAVTLVGRIVNETLGAGGSTQAAIAALEPLQAEVDKQMRANSACFASCPAAKAHMPTPKPAGAGTDCERETAPLRAALSATLERHRRGVQAASGQLEAAGGKFHDNLFGDRSSQLRHAKEEAAAKAEEEARQKRERNRLLGELANTSSLTKAIYERSAAEAKRFGEKANNMNRTCVELRQKHIARVEAAEQATATGIKVLHERLGRLQHTYDLVSEYNANESAVVRGLKIQVEETQAVCDKHAETAGAATALLEVSPVDLRRLSNKASSIEQQLSDAIARDPKAVGADLPKNVREEAENDSEEFWDTVKDAAKDPTAASDLSTADVQKLSGVIEDVAKMDDDLVVPSREGRVPAELAHVENEIDAIEQAADSGSGDAADAGDGGGAGSVEPDATPPPGMLR